MGHVSQQEQPQKRQRQHHHSEHGLTFRLAINNDFISLALEHGLFGFGKIGRAASSAMMIASLWSSRIEPGTCGVTGPKKDSRIAHALSSPLATTSTFFAVMIVWTRITAKRSRSSGSLSSSI